MSNSENQGRRTAGAFDVRLIIAGLIGLYGVVLVIVAAFQSEGRAINLWSGLAMVAAAIFFAVWTKLRPIVIPESAEEEHEEARRDVIEGNEGD